MAHGLKVAEIRACSSSFRGLEHNWSKGSTSPVLRTPLGQKWRKSVCSSSSKSGQKLEQNWSKLEQQRGRCSSRREPPKGGFPVDKWSTSPVRLQNWRR